ncbi:MAG: hypothetical protein WCZ65_07595 [Lysobacteraceae bacterium]
MLTAAAQDLPRPLRWLLLGLLMLIVAAPYPATTIILDLARDLVAAMRIGSGAELPLRGPVINAMGHLGPAWFYLLALPLWLSGSTAFTLLFIGLLAALKVPLAFALGRRLDGPALGWAFAVAMCLPGWAQVSALIVTHTSVVETMLLASALAALRLAERATPGRWIALGLALSMALHAHPSTLALGPLLVLLHRPLRALPGRHLLVGGGLLVLAAALPFLPALLAEWRDGWPLRAGVARYAQDWADSGSLARLALGGAFGGGWMLSEHLSDGLPRIALRLILPLLWLVALAGALRAALGRQRRLLLVLAAGLLACLAGVHLLRPQHTPFYMVLAAWPLIAGTLAAGVAHWLARTQTRWLGLGWLLLTALVAGHASLLPILAAERGGIRLAEGAIIDVRRFDSPASDKAVLPAWRAERLARRLCATRNAVVMHAELAALTDAALALPIRLRCGEPDWLGIGGGADHRQARHLLGLSPVQLRALGLKADARWGDTFSLAPARVIAAAGSERVPDGSRYPFRLRTATPLAEHRWEFEAAADEVVLVSQLFQLYDGASTLGVSANGRVLTPALQSFATSAWRCADCAEPVRWQVDIRTDLPGRADIVIAAPPR